MKQRHRKVITKMGLACLPLPLLVAATGWVARADNIKGKVTDEAGKPVRCAVVKATDASNKTIAGYSPKGATKQLASR